MGTKNLLLMPLCLFVFLATLSLAYPARQQEISHYHFEAVVFRKVGTEWPLAPAVLVTYPDRTIRIFAGSFWFGKGLNQYLEIKIKEKWSYVGKVNDLSNGVAELIPSNQKTWIIGMSSYSADHPLLYSVIIGIYQKTHEPFFVRSLRDPKMEYLVFGVFKEFKQGDREGFLADVSLDINKDMGIVFVDKDQRLFIVIGLLKQTIKMSPPRKPLEQSIGLVEVPYITGRRV